MTRRVLRTELRGGLPVLTMPLVLALVALPVVAAFQGQVGWTFMLGVRPPMARIDTLGGHHQPPAAILWPNGRCIQSSQGLPDERCRLTASQAGRQLAVAATEWANCGGSGGRGAPATLRAGVRAWLLDRPGDAQAVTRHIASMSESEREDWLDRYLTAAQNCDFATIDELRPR